MTAWATAEHAEFYVKGRPPYQNLVIPWLIDYYHRIPAHPDEDSKIPLAIDVACGSGQLTGELADFCDRVIGVDISMEMLEAAKRHNGHSNVDYRLGSAQELSKVCEGEKADIITVGMAINYFDNEEFYSKVRELLKPDGVFAVFGYKTPGICEHGLQTLFTEFMTEQLTDEPYRTAMCSLTRSYDNVRIPFKGEEHRMDTMLVPMDLDSLKALLMSNEEAFKDGREGVEGLMKKIPTILPINMICDVFGILTYV